MKYRAYLSKCSRTASANISSADWSSKGRGSDRLWRMSGWHSLAESMLTQPSFFLVPHPRLSLTDMIDLLINLQRPAGCRIKRKLICPFEAFGLQRRFQGRIFNHAHNGCCDVLRLIRRYGQGGITGHLGAGRGVAGHDRGPAGKGLNNGKTKALIQ